MASVGGAGRCRRVEQVQQLLTALQWFIATRGPGPIAPSFESESESIDMTLPFNFSPARRRCCRRKCWNRCAPICWSGIGMASGQGASVMEISHRGKAFEALIAEAEQDLRDLLAIPANYRVIFMQGGAWGSSAAVPMNLLRAGETADHLVRRWSKSAVGEAAKFGAVNVLASSENDGYNAGTGARKRVEVDLD